MCENYAGQQPAYGQVYAVKLQILGLFFGNTFYSFSKHIQAHLQSAPLMAILMRRIYVNNQYRVV